MTLTREAAILGRKNARLHIELLHRIHDGLVGAGAVANIVLRQDVCLTVELLLVVGVAGACDVRRRCTPDVADARGQRGKIEWIATIEGQVYYAFLCDDGTCGGGIGFEICGCV